MLTDPANFVALHRRWFWGIAIALGVAGGWYYAVARLENRWPGGSSTPGLVLGIAAGLIIVFECALVLRKTRWFRTRRFLGTAQLWMKAHIWLGLLVAPLAWMHSGLEFGGAFTSVLMWLLLIVVASGVFGLWMQNVVPRWLLDHVPEETIYSQIDVVRRQYADEAGRIVSLSCGQPRSELSEAASANFDMAQAEHRDARFIGLRRRVGKIVAKTAEGSDEWQKLASAKPLWQAYEQVVKPFLEGRGPSKSPLSSRRRSRDYFDSVRTGADEQALETLNALEHLCDKTRDLQLQEHLHVLLQSWLAVHLPLSLSLLILLVIHVFYALRIG